jgi:hypothetical protein
MVKDIQVVHPVLVAIHHVVPAVVVALQVLAVRAV